MNKLDKLNLEVQNKNNLISVSKERYSKQTIAHKGNRKMENSKQANEGMGYLKERSNKGWQAYN